MKDRRKFSREFKLAAVKKVVEQGLPAAEVARDLGIRDSLLHTWKRKLETEGTLRLPKYSVDEELQRLREENRRLKIERDILKKATIFFVRERAEVRVHPSASRLLANCDSVSRAASEPMWILQMAVPETIIEPTKARKYDPGNQTHSC